MAANTSDGRQLLLVLLRQMLPISMLCASIRSSSAAYLHEMMLHCALCMLSASRYSTACTGLQGTRGRALSQALYMYTCATQAVAAQTAGAARTRVQSHYDVQQPRLHKYPVRPAVFTRGQPGRRDSLSQGSRTCCQHVRHVRQLELALLDSRGFAVPLL